KVPGSRIPNPESRVPESFGRVLGWLYGWNTLGARLGVLIGVPYLLGALGVRGTPSAAGGSNLVAAALAGLVSVRGPGPATRLEPARRGPGERFPSSPSRPTGLSRPLIAIFLFGFCLLALEVIWFRFLLLFVKGHSIAFAVMLA